MDEREQKILGKYAYWKGVIENHGLQAPGTIEEFLEVASCNGTGCLADSCSGGNGSGCIADACSAGDGDKVHEEYVASLVETRKQMHSSPPPEVIQ